MSPQNCEQPYLLVIPKKKTYLLVSAQARQTSFHKFD